jgi:class 3 adenylate cyclase/predicted ATPase
MVYPMSDLRNWLEMHNLGALTGLLTENEVDLEILPELGDSDLASIGLALGPRKKLLKAIRTLVDTQDHDATSESALHPYPSGEAERRQLTVMFADLVGSTELSQQLDPEDLRDINRAYQETATVAIKRYSGFVARYMGDGLLAYFGYPLAHEDDAERALRAGLELIEAVTALQMGVPLAVRVGVATGPVVVGDIIGEGSAQESAVVGETPNLAARMQGIAAPNTLVLSEATRNLVTGRFEFDALGPQVLKGIAQPVPVYRALAIREVSRFDAPRERRLTPMVGRNEELRMILQRWGLAAEGEGQAVLLCGEAGIGKSRIVRALEDSIAKHSSNRIHFYCSPYHQSSAFHPAIGYLERTVGVGAEQTPKGKLSSLKSILSQLDIDFDNTSPIFAELLSIQLDDTLPDLVMSPEKLRLRILDALIDFVTALAAQKPTLFVVEDAHWIDQSTQDFLTYLIEQISARNVFVLITHRPEYESRWTTYSHVTAISLNNLGHQDSVAMVTEMTRERGLPKTMVDEIIARSDGVPLFIEEISAALSDAGFTTNGKTADLKTGNSLEAGIPVTLQDLLMERLDRMGPAKEVAQLAAVIGRSFSLELLKEVVVCSVNELEKSLSLLIESGLIYGGRGAGATFEFKHALVRDAAYQSLLKRERQISHRRIATILLGESRQNTPPELLAHHFEEGGQLDESARYWRQAGERALGRFAHVEAISAFTRSLAALDTLPEDDERRRFELETRTLLGPSLMFVLGQAAPEVEQTYARAITLGEQLKDPQASFTSAWGLWRLQFARGDMETGTKSAMKCQEIASSFPDPVANLGAAFALGATNVFSGECSPAVPHLENSIELYRAMEDKSPLAVFGQDPGLSSLCYLAWANWVLGCPDQAIIPCQEAIDLARNLGKPVFIAIASGFAGATYALRKDIPKLTECAQESLFLCEQNQFSQWAAMAKIMLGYAHSYEGEHDRAIELAKTGINEKEALHSYIAMPWFCSMAAEIFLAAGQLQEAQKMALKGIDYANRGGERFFEPENHRLLAVVLAKMPNQAREEVQSHLNNALAMARRQKAKSLELRVITSITQLASEPDDRRNGLKLLSSIYNSFSEGLSTFDLKLAKAYLETS